MISDRTVVRLRAALDEWFALVVVALLALSLVGGWATYGTVAASDEADEINQRTVEAWSTTGGFEHGATVQQANEVFPVGTELSDRPVYFTDVSPELEATFRFSYDAPDGDVDVTIGAERVVRSVGDEGVEHWSVNETIAETRDQGLEPGQEGTTAFSLDVPSAVNHSERVEESLGGSTGTVETVVVARVTMTGTIDGETVDRVETYELVVDTDGATYSVDAPAAERRVEERTESVTAASTSGVLGSFVPLFLTLASICALGTLAVARSNGTLAPSEAELERVRDQYEREEFDDWISRGSLPGDIRERSRIEVATLEDLVDVAIDCDRRVIEDERGDERRYYVVDGDSLYAYEPDSSDERALEEAESDGGENEDEVRDATDGNSLLDGFLDRVYGKSPEERAEDGAGQKQDVTDDES